MNSALEALTLRWTIFLFAALGCLSAFAQAPTILAQPEDQVVPVGGTATFNVFASGTQPLTYRWFFGTQLLAQASSTLTLINVNTSQAGEYSVVVSNVFGAVTSTPSSLIVLPLLPGMLDPTFNTGSGANGVVRTIATDVDSRIYIGGEFSSFNGAPKGFVARLNPDGSLDPFFPAGSGAGGSVFAVAVQDNGQVLIGGNFQQVNGVSRVQLAKLNGDGTVDTTFDAGITGFGSIWTIVLQPDGKILIGGDFTSVGGFARSRIARLNANGTPDTTFNPGSGMNDSVRSIVLQPNGQILVGGLFTFVNGSPRNRIVRLTSTGGIDFGFNIGSGPDYWVNRLALQPDGKVLVGGNFYTFNGVQRPYLARLQANGALDTTFGALQEGPNGPVTAIAVQTNGNIVIGGGFTQVNQQAHPYIARLNSAGAIDEGFFSDAAASYWVESLALQVDGHILLGGAFQFVNSVYQGYIARLLGNDPPPFVPLLTQQPPAQQTVSEGNNVQLIARAVAYPAPGYQWQLNGTNLPGAITPSLSLNNVRITNAGSYRLIVSNAVGSVTSRVAVVNITPARTTPGAVDLAFFSGTGPNYIVRSVAVQPDGKTLIAGYFDRVNGLPGTNIARLNVDGSVDQTFIGSAPYGVNQIAALPSGSILIGGGFSYVNGIPRSGIARLLPNGALDNTFSPAFFSFGNVVSFLVQTNGKVIIVGGFTIIENGARTNIARLNPNGSLDTSFNAGLGVNGQITALAEDGSGRILMGGDFNTFNGVPRNNLVRLNADGTVDTTFNIGSGPGAAVSAVRMQSDGKIIIAGAFRAFNGVPRRGVARLNSDGTLDTTFDPGIGPNGIVYSIALQGGGRTVIGGGFTEIAGFPRDGLGRLNSDGSLDLSFDPGSGADAAVYSIAEVPSGPEAGKLVVGGAFLRFDTLPRPYLVRILGGSVAPTTPSIVRQPQNVIVQAGEDVEFSVLALGGPDLRYQWQLGGTNIAGATLWTYTLHNVRATNGGTYTVTVSNALGGVISSPATLTVNPPSRQPGAPDINFYSGTGPNDRVHAIAVQADGKIVIGGAFTEVNGTPRSRIARLRTSGGLDTTFDPQLGANDRVFAVAVQPDGKILAAGSFTKVNNLTRNRIVRFETNGAVDQTFASVLGPDAEVNAIALHTNGTVLIGGRFGFVDGTPRNGLARLRSDGSLDSSFSPMLNQGAVLFALAVQPDLKIMIGGIFFSVDGISRTRTTRLNADGTIDSSFALDSVSSTVLALGLQSDRKVLLGGDFLFVDPLPRVRVARLDTNGFVDTTFTNAAPNETVNALLSQPDHRTVIGGSFTNLGLLNYVDEYGNVYTFTNYPRYRIARLETNGLVDLTFASGSGVQGGTGYIDEYGQVSDLTTVLALARDANGRILVGGDFTRVNGITRPYIARLFSRVASDVIVIHRGLGVVELFWDTGTLQEADNVAGPWSDVPNAESPLLYSIGGGQKFFRVKFN